VAGVAGWLSHGAAVSGLAEAPAVLEANLGGLLGRTGMPGLNFPSHRAVQRHAEGCMCASPGFSKLRPVCGFEWKTTLRFAAAEVSEDGEGRGSLVGFFLT